MPGPRWARLLLLWRWMMVVGLLTTVVVTAGDEDSTSSEMTCHADGTCQSNKDGPDTHTAGTAAAAAAAAATRRRQQRQRQQQQQQQEQLDHRVDVTVINHSKFRADVYYDDGRFGSKVLTLKARGGTETLNSVVGHSFFVTRHGVKEGLFDLETDTPIRYTVAWNEDPEQTQASTSAVLPLVIPADAAPSPNPCQDRFSVCPKEAARGECWVNPGWMIVHCCQSCNDYMDAAKFIDRNVRCSPEHLNMTGPAWQPGDLHDLFVKWSTEERFKPYQPRVLSSPQPDVYGGDIAPTEADPNPPWVLVFDQFLSDEEADALIDGGRSVGFQRSTDQGKVSRLGEQEQVVSQGRTSLNAWCTGACADLPLVDAISQRIEDVTQIPRRNYEQFQILEYDTDQFYKSHHDSSSRSTDTVAGPRILTFFLYLSDVEEGGATHFTTLGLGVTPKKGRALIWPSVKDDNPRDWDRRMFHEAQPVLRGKKYAANHWIHLNDYATANEWGCSGSFS